MKYAGMPVGMWMRFAPSFRNQLTAVFGYGTKTAKAITKKAKPKYREIISELSQGMTLRAGTIIATGTPAGVGMGFTPPKFLKKGDVVTCEIKGIGKLTNTVE